VRSRNHEAPNLVFFQSYVTSSLLRHTHSSALFSAALVLCSCPNGRDKVSHPCETKCKITGEDKIFFAISCGHSQNCNLLLNSSCIQFWFVHVFPDIWILLHFWGYISHLHVLILSVYSGNINIYCCSVCMFTIQLVTFERYTSVQIVIRYQLWFVGMAVFCTCPKTHENHILNVSDFMILWSYEFHILLNL
jgi:hypothetical protein